MTLALVRRHNLANLEALLLLMEYQSLSLMWVLVLVAAVLKGEEGHALHRRARLLVWNPLTTTVAFGSPSWPLFGALAGTHILIHQLRGVDSRSSVI